MNIGSILQKRVPFIFEVAPLLVLPEHTEWEAPEKQEVLKQDRPDPPRNKIKVDIILCNDSGNLPPHNKPRKNTLERAVQIC